MNRLSTGLVAVGSVIAAGLYAGPALASPDVVFVDPNIGLDTQPCTETQPCRTLTKAQTVVADPGTIIILSSGTLAPVSIATSLTIACPGGGCIIDGSASQIAIGVVAPSKSVALHNLSLAGYDTGLEGIEVTEVSRLELKGVRISGFQFGIFFIPGVAGAASHLFVQDSEIRNSSARNVVIAPISSNSVSAVFTGTKVHHANAGIVADASGGTGNVSLVIKNSDITFANNNAILANGNAAGATASVLIDGSEVSYSSGNCILANGATAQVALSKTMVTQCGTALNPLSGGQIFTYGDNAVNFNTSNGTAPTTAGGFR
jgi:hypothetical protein